MAIDAGMYPGNNFDFEQSMHSKGSFGYGPAASSCASGCGPGSVWNAAVAASACGCLWDECYDGWSVVGRWNVLADSLMLKRNQSHSVPFATLDNSERVVLATRVQDFPFRPAMRLGVGVPLSPRLRIEGLYFGLANWTETAAVRDATTNSLGGTGNLFSRLSNFGNPASTALDYNSLASFAYYSALDNAEFNLRHRLPTPPYVEASLLFGGRYISVRERLSFGTHSNVPTSNLVETRTQNDMVGLQIGGALNVPVHWGWWFQGEIKGVLMQNSASQATAYTHTDTSGETTYLGNKSSKVATYAGDLALWLSYQCTPRFVVRFGYQAFWFDGLALASQNVERNINILTLGPAQLLHGGRVVYHGPSAGVTFSW
ncbi:MAG: BBP7 family outer membrane beta-barrel protein [Pirellulales bacterium]|nr:BBP7 family outer membrane beta-barrel protein [Pirellulales bacterium]